MNSLSKRHLLVWVCSSHLMTDVGSCHHYLLDSALFAATQEFSKGKVDNPFFWHYGTSISLFANMTYMSNELMASDSLMGTCISPKISIELNVDIIFYQIIMVHKRKERIVIVDIMAEGSKRLKKVVMERK